jgi:hypothetical protein
MSRRPNHRTRWTRRSPTCTEILPPGSNQGRVVLVPGERTVVTQTNLNNNPPFTIITDSTLDDLTVPGQYFLMAQLVNEQETYIGTVSHFLIAYKYDCCPHEKLCVRCIVIAQPRVHSGRCLKTRHYLDYNVIYGLDVDGNLCFEILL